MIETSVTAWAQMLILIFGASLVGLLLARHIPWTPASRAAGIPLAFAIAIAPFLAGLSTVFLLLLFPSAGHRAHLAGVFFSLSIIGLAAAFLKPFHGMSDLTKIKINGSSAGKWDWFFGGLLAVWVIGLISESLFVPLLANDALEYATVGRLLFEIRNLHAYPAIDPLIGSSGFFGPWTHPPLYVSLIYLTNVIQDHAEAPGMMRLIAPWFALSAAALVYSLGSLRNRTAGLSAALIFLSTPLFYLGAGSALIDALPVSGMALLFCTLIAVDGSPVRKGIVQGLMLGVAMWTHSESVLFVPLALVGILAFTGWRNPYGLWKQIAALLTVAVLVAIWPYWNNFKLFGSFISDNPAVFAMKKLEWAEYFRISRGLDSWIDKIQYGVFKGWFASESFSITFWIMTLGAILYLTQLHRRRSWSSLLRGDTERIPERCDLAALSIIVCYLCGIAASLLAGSDLMIRNERYLLVLVPFVAMIAGSGLSDVARRPTKTARLFILFVFLVLSAQFLVVGTLDWRSYKVGPSNILSTHEEKLEGLAPYDVMHYLRQETPPTATVFSLQPADMYYAHRRMISYLDPRLLAFYQEDNADLAWQRLQDLGVRYIHARDRSFPPLYNSSLQEILARDDLTRLVFSEGGYQIYEMRREDPKATVSAVDFTPGSIPWTLLCEIVVGGEKGLFRFPMTSKVVVQNDVAVCASDLPLFHREISASLRSAALTSIRGDFEYRLDLLLKGQAFAQIYLQQYDAYGHQIDESLIGETVAGQTTAETQFRRRFKTKPQTTAIRVAVKHRGSLPIGIAHAEMALLAKDKNAF